jgi:hypothetical protein
MEETKCLKPSNDASEFTRLRVGSPPKRTVRSSVCRMGLRLPHRRRAIELLFHISPRSRARSGAGWAEFGGIRDPAELSTTDPPNRCHLPVWHWRVEPLDIDDAFRGGNGIGDEYYLIADFEKLL